MTMLPVRTPIILETGTSLRTPNPNQTPIHGSTGNWYAIYAIKVDPPIKPMDVFDVSFALHVTNDAFRPDPNQVTWNTSVRFSDTTQDAPQGTIVMANAGAASIGNEAHHALTTRRAFFTPGGSTPILTTKFFVLRVWFRHGNANGNQQMTCPDNALGMQAYWYKS